MKIRILFASSAEISIPLLKRLDLDDHFEVLGLLCQPDRPKGRKQELQASKLKSVALDLGIKIYQPESLNKDQELIRKLSASNFDFLLTFAYGQILGPEVLRIPKLKALNVHTSLLPKYRGASPIQASLLNGDLETGISLIEMVEKMDAGPIYAQKKISINSMNAQDLHDALAILAAEKIPKWILDFKSLVPKIQDESKVSFCKKIKKSDGFLYFSLSEEEILRRYRAYFPWPGLWTYFGETRVKILNLCPSSLELKPAEFSVEDGRLNVGVHDGSLELTELQPEGRKALSASDFCKGFSHLLDERLPLVALEDEKTA